MSVAFEPASSVPPRRLLIRGVNWLGDAVMITPALMRLREALPGTHITLLTREKLAGLWPDHPALDKVLTIQPGESVWSVGGRLRADRFDTALILPNSPRSAIEVWLAGVPRRIGYSRPWRAWSLTQALPPRPGQMRMRKKTAREIHEAVSGGAERPTWPASAHQIHEYLHLGAALGADPTPRAPLLAVNPECVAATRAKFQLPVTAPLGALNVGAEYGPAKRWPVERFVAVVRDVHRRTGCHWIVLGGPGDVPLANQVTSALDDLGSVVHGIAGLTTLQELMAVLLSCKVLLTNDTGPMHVAAALGIPVVAPFGSTSPELTGPGLPGDELHRLIRSEAPCSPCFLRTCPIDFRCMTGITVERVTAEVMRALGTGNA